MWCIVATVEARAQAPLPPAVATAPASPASLALTAPTDDEALTAFLAAREWLDADQLPDVESAAARVELPETTAVCVLLRLDGRVVGAGDDARVDGNDSGALMVRRATGRAVAQALGDETIRSVRASLGDRITKGLSLEIELAGSVSPLLGRTIAEAAMRVEPGVDGLAVLRAGVTTRAFPGRLLAYDLALRADATITNLLRTAGLPAKDLTEFAAADRVSLGRFRSTRLRQATPSASPCAVTRSGRVIEESEVTPAFTRTLATQLTARLAGQVLPRVPTDASKGVLLLGTYSASSERYDPPSASDRDAAFAAFALSRAAASSGIPQPTRMRANAQALALARTLAAGPSPMHLPAVDAFALLVFARGETPTAADTLARETLANRLLTAGAASALEPELAALIAAALAASGSPAAVERADALLGGLLTTHETSVAPLIDAALGLALLLENPAVDPGLRLRVSKVLKEVAQVIASLQISASDGVGAEFAADLQGGLLLPRFRFIRSDAQCLKLAAAMAIALPLTALNSDPLAPRLNARFMRFLAQHVAADPWVDGYRSASALRGLVRASLATAECPAAATAVGVLFAATAADDRAIVDVSAVPSVVPSVVPSAVPSVVPSVVPSKVPSTAPSTVPAIVPSINPSTLPSTPPSTTP